MALINPTISLDTKNKYTDTIFLTQGEYGSRQINFTLTHGGVAIDLTGCAVNFLAKKPSGATLTNACVLTTPANGKFTYTVTQQTSVEAGSLTDARIEVVKTDVLLRSFKINVTVEAVPDYTTAIESTDEFTALAALSGQIAQIGTLSTLLTTVKTSLVAAVNELFTNKLNKAGGSENPFTAMPYLGTAPIVESGAGYIKYADGTMIESFRGSVTPPGSLTAAGSIFQGSVTFPVFPIEFYATPNCVKSIVTFGGVFCWGNGSTTDYTKTTPGTIVVFCATNSVPSSLIGTYIAVGRWKA